MTTPLMSSAMGPLASPATERPSRSILDGVLKALYPAGAYGDLLTEEQLGDERRMQLRRAGLMLMGGAGSRPADQPHNFMGDLAEALDPAAWEQRLSHVAETGMQLRAAQQKIEQEQQAEAIMRTHAAKPGETAEEQDQRLLSMANAFQQAGLMEHAKAAADLRTSLRAPALGEKDGVLYDTRTGRVMGQLPQAMRTVEGSQLYAQALQRIQPWDRVRSAVTQYNSLRGVPLTQPNSAALISVAQDLLNTHSALAQNESDFKALEHLPIAGQLFRVLQAFSGSSTLTEPQRQELLKAVDPIISLLAKEHSRVLTDVQRIFRNKWKDQTEFNQMWSLLPQSPSFTPGGVQVPRVVQDMNDDRR